MPYLTCARNRQSMDGSFSLQLYYGIHKALLLIPNIIVVEDPGIVTLESAPTHYHWNHKFLDQDQQGARAQLISSVLVTLKELSEPIVSWYDTQIHVLKTPDQPSLWSCQLSLFIVSQHDQKVSCH